MAGQRSDRAAESMSGTTVIYPRRRSKSWTITSRASSEPFAQPSLPLRPQSCRTVARRASPGPPPPHRSRPRTQQDSSHRDQTGNHVSGKKHFPRRVCYPCEFSRRYPAMPPQQEQDHPRVASLRYRAHHAPDSLRKRLAHPLATGTAGPSVRSCFALAGVSLHGSNGAPTLCSQKIARPFTPVCTRFAALVFSAVKPLPFQAVQPI